MDDNYIVQIIHINLIAHDIIQIFDYVHINALGLSSRTSDFDLEN
jgi:hypothetical protein